MSAMPHIIILGAGLVGLSCADALLARGAQVTVIDTRPGPVQGASFSNSGMIHPSQAWQGLDAADEPIGKAVHALAWESRERVRGVMERLGLELALARPAGCFQIYASLKAARQQQEIMMARGVAADVIVDSERTFGQPALFFPHDRSANAYDFGVALAKDLQQRGVMFIHRAGEQGLALRRTADGVAVRLGDHRFAADHLIIAAGASSQEILKVFDLDLPMDPVRGFAVNFARPDYPVPSVPVMDAQSRSALTLFSDHLRLSGTWGESSARPLLARWLEIAPELMKSLAPAQRIWSGLRPVTKLGRPVISATPIPGLWINTGHSHLGWTLCTASGALMAEMILDGRTNNHFVYEAAKG